MNQLNKESRVRIGARIAELRKEAGMTQQELAERSGLYRNHMTRIEQGRYSIGIDTLQAIAEALGKTVDIVDPSIPV